MTYERLLAADEPARLDPDRITALYNKLGVADADHVICSAMEELAVRLSHCERLYRQCDYGELRQNCEAIDRLADQVGLVALARVAVSVADCTMSGDLVALSATLARLVRVGERSLTAIWDLQDITI